MKAPAAVTLKLLAGPLAVCRLEAGAPVPAWAVGALTSVTRTPEELSVVCAEQAVPEGIRAERGFRCLSVVGPISFATSGLLASLSALLADAGVSIFVLSTFDTDLLLLRQADLAQAVAVLRGGGHAVTGLP